MYNELLKAEHIILGSKSTNQLTAFNELAENAKKLNLISNKNELINAFIVRESLGTTGFEDGIAIPHAQSDCINKPAVLIIRFDDPVDWKSVDGSKTKIAIAILLPKDKVKDMHIEILKNISLKLLNKDFVKKIKETNEKSWILDNLFVDKKPENIDNSTNENKKLIVGVSACTTGIAHTYICKELLEKEGKSMGYDVHIECQGQRGKEYSLTSEEIEKASAIIIAADIGIDLEPYQGRNYLHCSTDQVTRNPKGVIEAAIAKFSEDNSNINDNKKNNLITSENQADFIQAAGKGKPKVLKHLLSGCSYLIPFVVFAGLSFSIITGISKITYGVGFTFPTTWDHINSNTFASICDATKNITNIGFAHVLFLLNNMAQLGFEFMIPIMAAYIGYSICGRTALVSCFITAFLLTQPSNIYWYDWNGTFLIAQSGHNAAGFSWTLFAGIYAGFVGGFITLGLLKIRVPKWFAPVMPIIIIPVFSTLLTAIPAAFLLAAPVGFLMGKLDIAMTDLAKSTTGGFIFLKFFVGALVGAMIGFDLGGPINKIAVLVATALVSAPINSGGGTTGDGGALMGAAAAAIPIAPMGSGLASVFLGRKLFSKAEKTAGYNALLLGFMGISESGIPFLVRDTWRNMVPNLIGSAVAGGLCYVIGVSDRVGAYGSFIVGVLGGVSSVSSGSYSVLPLYFLAMVIGMVLHSVIYTSLLLQKEGKFAETFKIIQKKSLNIFKKNQNLKNKTNK